MAAKANPLRRTDSVIGTLVLYQETTGRDKADFWDVAEGVARMIEIPIAQARSWVLSDSAATENEGLRNLRRIRKSLETGLEAKLEAEAGEFLPKAVRKIVWSFFLPDLSNPVPRREMSLTRAPSTKPSRKRKQIAG